jgi:CheY-like chemotaxis protein
MTGVDPLPASEPLAGLRILIVEDEAMIALLIQDVLEEIGSVIVGPASRIPAALDLIAAEAVDLAVLDLNLAGQPVYPVAEVLADRGIPFVFITAMARSASMSVGGIGRPCRSHSGQPSLPARCVPPSLQSADELRAAL